MSNFYAKVFARFYDSVIQKAETKELADRRKSLLSDLKGNILEIGAGTGVNFQYYAKDAHILAVEPSPYMLRQAKEKKKDRKNVRLLQASVEQCYENKEVQERSMDAVVCNDYPILKVLNLQLNFVGMFKKLPKQGIHLSDGLLFFHSFLHLSYMGLDSRGNFRIV